MAEYNPYDPKAPLEDIDKQKTKLLGMPDYNAATDTAYQTAKTDVQSAIDYQYNPYAQKTSAQYKGRGFNAGVISPSLQNAAFKPLIDARLNAASSAIAKLGLDYQNLDLQKRADIRSNISLLDQLENSKVNRATAGDDGKVICTALFEIGLLSLEYMQYDTMYLVHHTNPKERQEYLSWGIPVANFLKQNHWAGYLVLPFVTLWSTYMKSVVLGKKPNVFGYALHKLGTGFGSLFAKLKQPIKGMN